MPQTFGWPLSAILDTRLPLSSPQARRGFKLLSLALGKCGNSAELYSVFSGSKNCPDSILLFQIGLLISSALTLYVILKGTARVILKFMGFAAFNCSKGSTCRTISIRHYRYSGRDAATGHVVFIWLPVWAML